MRRLALAALVLAPLLAAADEAKPAEGKKDTDQTLTAVLEVGF